MSLTPWSLDQLLQLGLLVALAADPQRPSRGCVAGHRRARGDQQVEALLARQPAGGEHDLAVQVRRRGPPIAWTVFGIRSSRGAGPSSACRSPPRSPLGQHREHVEPPVLARHRLAQRSCRAWRGSSARGRPSIRPGSARSAAIMLRPGRVATRKPRALRSARTSWTSIHRLWSCSRMVGRVRRARCANRRSSVRSGRSARGVALGPLVVERGDLHARRRSRRRRTGRRAAGRCSRISTS